MPIDTEALLAPVSGSDPAGTNLEYDPAFAELERVASGRPEQQIGSAIVPAEDPDWARAGELSATLLGRSKDLRIATRHARALSELQGFEGLSRGIAIIRGLLDRYWDTVHPRLDPDDGNDPIMRVNALAALAEPGFLNSLRSAPLVRSKSFGNLGLRELVAASGEVVQDGESKVEAAAVDAAFREGAWEGLQATSAALHEAIEHLGAIDAVFAEQAGGPGPELSPLVQLLKKATQGLSARLQLRPEAAGSSNGESAAGVVPGGLTPAVGSPTGDIRSRDDVLRALQRIETYYARYEPSSPIPFLLQRCKRLVPMSFMDIVKEIAPDGLSQVELVVGKRDEGAAQ